ncbi:MAG: AAA family ATPase [Desulfobacteraceae bacterium]|jgi:AAA+ ATPase superfamily predicted ATPase
MEIERELKLAPLLAMKSFFLFGPRATGKTTLIRRQLAETAFIIDFLDSRYFLRLSADPNELESLIAANPADIIVIDEIQRIPDLQVDFLIGTKSAIEVKASTKISKNDLKGLRYLKQEGVFQNLLLVSQDPVSICTDDILCIPWQRFLSDLWKDKFV